MAIVFIESKIDDGETSTRFMKTLMNIFCYLKFCCSVEKTAEKIEDACRFTSRLLEHGDAVEILALRRIVGAQLMNLIKNTPKHNVTFSIEFQTDYNQFEKTVEVNMHKSIIHFIQLCILVTFGM